MQKPEFRTTFGHLIRDQSINPKTKTSIRSEIFFFDPADGGQFRWLFQYTFYDILITFENSGNKVSGLTMKL
jgi:hypothetical protein